MDLGVPLSEVTFAVVDLETTGGSPRTCAITEVGAVKYRGGERLGTFQTLVDPGTPIPRFITHLTGLDDLAVAGAPPVEAVLPALSEFLAGTVFVAHNAAFDFGFLNTGFARLGYPPIPKPAVCTAKLGRRVVGPDVRNVRLATLAEYFRSPVKPTHRALPDAEACAEVLHGLLGLAGRLGILTLGDLYEAMRARGRPHYAKIRLADGLPRSPGVYLFRGREGRVLYVGKAVDIRARVKSYFYGDSRKKVADLLGELRSVEAVECRSELEALVVEARLIRTHEPKYNRRGRTWRRYAYVKLDVADAFPRLKVVREVKPADVAIGPFPSSKVAELAREALEEAFPVRRCRRPMRPATRFAPCALADIGRCLAPCDGRATPERYGELVRTLRASLSSPDGLLGTLERRLDRLAGQERFEEAALLRDRLRALAEALARSRVDGWLTAGRLVVRDRDGAEHVVERGSLAGPDDPGPLPRPYPRERADEVGAMRAWLLANADRVVVADPPLAEPVQGGAELHRVLSLLRARDRPERDLERT